MKHLAPSTETPLAYAYDDPPLRQTHDDGLTIVPISPRWRAELESKRKQSEGCGSCVTSPAGVSIRRPGL